jgi:hypothetical protein
MPHCVIVTAAPRLGEQGSSTAAPFPTRSGGEHIRFWPRARGAAPLAQEHGSPNRGRRCVKRHFRTVPAEGASKACRAALTATRRRLASRSEYPLRLELVAKTT